MIRVRVRVDDVADRPIRQLTQRRQQSIRFLCRPGIDEPHAEAADLHGDIRASADDHVHVALDGHGVETCLTARLSGGTTLCVAVHASGDNPQHDCGSDDEQLFEHGHAHFFAGAGGGIGIALTLSMYSGYIVSAPPRVGSIGSRCTVANSVKYGFLPGRWCGTYAGSRPGTSSSA